MSRIKAYFKFMLIAGLVFGTCFGIGAGLTKVVLNTGNEDNEIIEKKTIAEGERTNILVLGIDARPGERISRSDTMILASIDPKLNKAVLISIPRDTRVDIEGSDFDKICAANIVGGPELAITTVENLMGIDIDYYMEMNFNGFEKIVDTLGGVTINVDERKFKPEEGIDLYPGLQKLDGKDALAYVRYRGYAMGDIERTNYQQEFLKALADEVLKPKTIAKLSQLIKDLKECMETDLSVGEMIKMASWAPGFNSDSIITQTLPGYFFDEVDDYDTLLASYWIADSKHLAGLLDNLFNGETVSEVVDVPVSATRKVVAYHETEEEINNVEENDEQNSEKSEKERNIERSKLPSFGHDMDTGTQGDGSSTQGDGSFVSPPGP